MLYTYLLNGSSCWSIAACETAELCDGRKLGYCRIKVSWVKTRVYALQPWCSSLFIVLVTILRTSAACPFLSRYLAVHLQGKRNFPRSLMNISHNTMSTCKYQHPCWFWWLGGLRHIKRFRFRGRHTQWASLGRWHAWLRVTEEMPNNGICEGLQSYSFYSNLVTWSSFSHSQCAIEPASGKNLYGIYPE